ncbi:MFS transporter [Rhodococcus erythropolis]|uniref:MFS transporter n=1 Tax=Rhodococcus erythropolis TaxID=1833 RepID=UPI001292A93E|nr:MFS transporter [Rhodococcus erythropolis]MQP33623.1 MFS transporter [Rhodococcus erythropolis]
MPRPSPLVTWKQRHRPRGTPARRPSPLVQSPMFRKLWASTTLTAIAAQVASFAAVIAIWDATGSVLWMGMLGLAKSVPIIVFALVGGMLADRIDRRTIALTSTFGQAIALVAMTAAALGPDISPAVIFCLLALLSAASSVGSPARKALVVTLLPVDTWGRGLALTATSFQLSVLLGPAIGGIVAATHGVAGCFALATALAASAVYGIARLPRTPPQPRTPRPRRTSDGLLSGLRIGWRTPALRRAFLVDLNATVLAMPTALFPALNSERFGGQTYTLSLMFAALALGGILAGAASKYFAHSHRPAALMFGAALIWAISLLALAAAPHLAAALGVLAIAGAADTASVVARGVIVQREIADTHRGRISALDHIVEIAGPELGNARAGLIAQFTTATISLTAGSALSALGVLALAISTPRRRRHRTTRTETQTVTGPQE